MKIPRQLRKLQVIDRLEVGPVRLEPNRLVAPYSVTQGGRQETTELVYRYEQEVFDPGDAGQQNMAAVMAAQVALNYGLFCKEIKLRGPLDRADRRFLIEAARNTAREIYVNKLLAPNPFLLAEARDLPARRLDDFLLARITFDGDPCDPLPPWSTEQTRHAVRSSGGKDSLLSYGLLGELGLEPTRSSSTSPAGTGTPPSTPTVTWPARTHTPPGCGPTVTGSLPGCSGASRWCDPTSPACGRTSTRCASGQWPCSSPARSPCSANGASAAWSSATSTTQPSASANKGIKWYVRTCRISRTGVMGDPTRATAEKGREMWAVMVRNLVELVEDLRGRSLDAIHQRRC